ncbi:MAG TPA: hypothetical protein ENK62_03380 [Chromatiales bacterium]|nr:hypothetical protein [Chromatiales bacterium]
MAELALLVCLGILGWIAWQLGHAPRVNEARCPFPMLLDQEGRCPGACASDPPCTRETPRG